MSNWLIWFRRRVCGAEDIREIVMVCNKCACQFVARDVRELPFDHRCDPSAGLVERFL